MQADRKENISSMLTAKTTDPSFKNYTPLQENQEYHITLRYKKVKERQKLRHLLFLINCNGNEDKEHTVKQNIEGNRWFSLSRNKKFNQKPFSG